MNDNTAPAISVIIPVYHETELINRTIAHIKHIDPTQQCEIIVVDGARERDTIRVIDDRSVVTLAGPKGRAVQMNAGAEVARGRTLLFLHADTRLPDNAVARICETAAAHVGGAFSFAYDSERRVLRLFSRFTSWRCRLTRMPFGDQAIFLDRDYFFRIGRYREIPIMEEVDLVRRIKRRGDRLKILAERARTSPRRIEEEGMIYSGVRCAALLLFYAAGVSPERLKRYYPDRMPGATPPSPRPAAVPPSPQSPVSNRLHERQRI